MERTMWVVKHPKTGHYMRSLTRIVEGKAIHEASWTELLDRANRVPDVKSAEMMFMCNYKQLGIDYCEIQEVVVSVREVTASC